MTIKANGTHAKDIALHFLDLTTDRYTPSIVARTIKQAKSLLESGYTKEEIITSIDFILDKGTNIYSLGYISTCINNVLNEIKKQEQKVKIEEQKVKIQEAMKKTEAGIEGVKSDGESTQRNRDKSARIGVQSRLGEKFNFDMFEDK